MRGQVAGADAASYWRRRFVVLVAGLIVLGLAAWTLSSAIAVHPQAPWHARPGERAGAGHRVQDRGSPPARHHARHPRAGGGLSKRPSAGGHADAAGRPSGHGAIRPAFCARRSVVISVYTGQTQFGDHEWPAFDVSVVSTQPAACSFNVGSRHLALVIREGPARIWSSADCPAGTAGLITALGRGVPTVLSVTWSRRTSAPGCSGRVLAVPPGIYTAYATDDGLTSEPVTFRLG